jgi:hypothetical protein
VDGGASQSSEKPRIAIASSVPPSTPAALKDLHHDARTAASRRSVSRVWLKYASV